MNDAQIKFLLRDLVDSTIDKLASTEDLVRMAEALTRVVKDSVAKLDLKITDTKTEASSSIKEIAYDLNELELSLKDLINNSERTSLSKIKELSQRLTTEINRVEDGVVITSGISTLEDRISSFERKIPQLLTDFKKEIDEYIIPETGSSIVDKINSLSTSNDSDKIGIGHIKDLEADLHQIRINIDNVGKHGRGFIGGGSSQVYHDSTLSGNGTQASPLKVISSGGGYTVETPSGAVNDSNVTFTVTATPVYVVANGATYFENAGYTLSGLTVTMTLPVGTGGYIRSFHS